MSWAEIKKAINSTIGTSSVKPLNEIILDTVKTIAGASTTASGSTTVYSSTVTRSMESYGSYNSAVLCIAKFIAPKNGLYKCVIEHGSGFIAFGKVENLLNFSSSDSNLYYVNKYSAYMYSSPGGTLTDIESDNGTGSYFGTKVLKRYMLRGMYINYSGSACTGYFYANAGEPVVLFASSNSSYESITRVTVTCG